MALDVRVGCRRVVGSSGASVGLIQAPLGRRHGSHARLCSRADKGWVGCGVGSNFGRGAKKLSTARRRDVGKYVCTGTMMCLEVG